MVLDIEFSECWLWLQMRWPTATLSVAYTNRLFLIICCLFSADVDECLVNNGGCAHMCNNRVGSFECSCTEGYEFDSLPDGRIPDLTNAGWPCIGTYYMHVCTTIVIPVTCNINECERNTANCSHICINTIGTSECDVTMDMNYLETLGFVQV